MEIKPVTKYPCPETGELFDSSREALENATKVCANRRREKEKAAREESRAQKLEQLRNSIRLEAESLGDIEEMLNSRAKLLLPNLKLPKIIISNVYSTKFKVGREDYLKISFQLNFPDAGENYDKVCKVVETGYRGCNGFYGFKSGGGGTARKYVSISTKDFPKMSAKYRQMLKLERDSMLNDIKLNKAAEKARLKAIATPEYAALVAQIRELENKKQELSVSLRKKYYKEPKLKDVAGLEELKAAFTI